MNNNFYEIPNDWYSEFNGNMINPMDNNMNMYNIPNMFNMGPPISTIYNSLFY